MTTDKTIDNSSLFGERIAPEVRETMTVMPPPVITQEGEILPYPDSFFRHYADMKVAKQQHPLWMEDFLDNERAGDHLMRRRLFIRCMSSEADLRLILAAARHLNLVSAFDIERGETESLAKTLERGYVDVHYSVVMTEVPLDDDTTHYYPVCPDARRIREIWRGLFTAAGYKVRFGGALNVRRLKI